MKQAEANIGANRAAVATARINLAYTCIIDPISGRIDKSHVTMSALTTAHQAVTLTTVRQLDPFHVDAIQSNAKLLMLKRRITEGRTKGASLSQAAVKLTLEDGTPYPVEVTLNFPNVTVKQGTGFFILRVVFPNENCTPLPGMHVRSEVKEGVVSDVILAPQQVRSATPRETVWNGRAALSGDTGGRNEKR